MDAVIPVYAQIRAIGKGIIQRVLPGHGQSSRGDLGELVLFRTRSGGSAMLGPHIPIGRCIGVQP